MKCEIENHQGAEKTTITITIDRDQYVTFPNRIKNAFVSPYGIIGWVDDTEVERGPHIYDLPRESVPYLLVEWAYWLAIDQQKKELHRAEFGIAHKRKKP